MFEKNDKRRIYWLIDAFLKGNITEEIFCDEFYYSFDLEIDYNSLNPAEYKLFNELAFVVSRFTSNDEELIKYPKAYFSRKELNDKISYVSNELHKIQPEYFDL